MPVECKVIFPVKRPHCGCQSSLCLAGQHFFHRCAQNLDHAPGLRRSGAVGGHQHDDVADGARQHALSRHRFADAEARALAQGEGRARPPVLDQFDADHEADLPDVPDVRQRPERLECFAERGFQPPAGLLGGAAL